MLCQVVNDIENSEVAVEPRDIQTRQKVILVS